jgi:hypothetical protein
VEYLFVIFVIFCFFSEVAFHFLESCPPAGSKQIQPGLPALQPRQKHASSRICEICSELRAHGEWGGWPPPEKACGNSLLAWIWFRQHLERMPASASQVDHNIAAGDVVADLWQGENPPRRLQRAVC